MKNRNQVSRAARIVATAIVAIALASPAWAQDGANPTLGSPDAASAVQGSGTVGDSIRNVPASSAPPSASAPSSANSDDSSDDSISVTGGVPGGAPAAAPSDTTQAQPAVATAPRRRRRSACCRSRTRSGAFSGACCRGRACCGAVSGAGRADHRRRRRACGRAVHGYRANRAAAFGTGSRGARGRERTSACGAATIFATAICAGRSRDCGGRRSRGRAFNCYDHNDRSRSGRPRFNPGDDGRHCSARRNRAADDARAGAG